MEKPLWTEIIYHLAKAQTMLADGVPTRDIQLEINIAKSLVENHIDHETQIDEQQIGCECGRISSMSDTLHQL